MTRPVALLGGTFNPPHLGHVQGALAALDQLGIEKLGLMPCKLPPHKTTAGVSDAHRVAMVKLLCQRYSRLYPQLIELDLPAPSYTVKTLSALRERMNGTPIVFIIGEDSLNTLDSWYEWRRLLSLCHLVVMRREDPNRQLSAEMRKWLEEHRTHDPAQIKNARCGHVFIAQTAYHAASSTVIRNNSMMNSAVSQWLPDVIIDYINQHNLYSNTK